MPPIDWAIAAAGAVGPLLANEMVKAARFSRAALPAAPALPALDAE
jgi:hypothetical protein